MEAAYNNCGVLDIRGHFDYSIADINVDLNRTTCDEVLLKYLKFIDEKTDIEKLLNKNVFICKIIRVNMGYIFPIIGMIVVEKTDHYEITHLSIHENFRNQGLAKTLLFSFFCHMYDKFNDTIKENEVLTITVPLQIDDMVMLFRKLKFSEFHYHNGIKMIKPMSKFSECFA